MSFLNPFKSSPKPLNTHPYYPPTLVLAGYTPNTLSLPLLLAGFSLATTALLPLALLLARRARLALRTSRKDQFLLLWFTLSGALHCIFEGYFVYTHARLPGAHDFLAQLWKEYAKSDSRYLTADPFVLSVEAVTAIIFGPLSFLTAYTIATDSAFRFPLQALVSTGHLYADTLYYLTALLDTRTHSRPEPLYFWGYFVATNMFWIIVPAYILYDSVIVCVRAIRVSRLEVMRRARPKKD